MTYSCPAHHSESHPILLSPCVDRGVVGHIDTHTHTHICAPTEEIFLRRHVRLDIHCLAPKGARKRKYLQLDLHAFTCRLAAKFKAGQDTRSGQGALVRRHTDGPLWAALLKTTVMCEAWR
jgi:hypothetical protein